MDLRKRSGQLPVVAALVGVVLLVGLVVVVVRLVGDDDDGDDTAAVAGLPETTTTTELPDPVDACELVTSGQIEDNFDFDVGDAMPTSEPASLQPHFCRYQSDEAFRGNGIVYVSFFPAPAGQQAWDAPIDNAEVEAVDGVGDEGRLLRKQGGAVEARALIDQATLWVEVSGLRVVGQDPDADRDRVVDLLKSGLSKL